MVTGVQTCALPIWKAIFQYVRATDFVWSALRTNSRFGPAGWKEQALRLRRHRLAEQEIRGRIDEVGRSVDSLPWTFVSHPSAFTAHVEGCSQSLDKSRHRGETPRTRSSAAEEQGYCPVSRRHHRTVQFTV